VILPCLLDWDEYNSSLPTWLTGTTYRWDAAAMKRECPMDKVAEYYYLYFGLDDDGARMLLWDVFGKGSYCYLFIYLYSYAIYRYR
jgi:hypothetical protein